MSIYITMFIHSGLLYNKISNNDCKVKSLTQWWLYELDIILEANDRAGFMLAPVNGIYKHTNGHYLQWVK